MSEFVPIFVDKAAKPVHYFNGFSDKLLVSSVFHTIQGEGPFMGQVATFLRLAGCNFGGKGVTGPGCPWCDTDFRMSEASWMTFDQVYESIIRVREKGLCRRLVDHNLLVVTGGEPLMQKALGDFILDLYSRENNMVVQIETNGTRPLSTLPSETVIVMSPKIPEWVDRPDVTVDYPRIKSDRLARADALKILISGDPCSPYHHVPGFAYKFAERGKPVYLSPINEYIGAPTAPGTSSLFDRSIYDHAACEKNHKRAAELALRHYFQLSLQMHVVCGIA